MTGASYQIKKVMSLTVAEFHRSLKRLVPNIDVSEEAYSFQIPEGNGYVEISIDVLPSQTYGGLLELPRARIILNFTGLNDSERNDFITRFDRVFQRGGG